MVSRIWRLEVGVEGGRLIGGSDGGGEFRFLYFILT